MGAVWWNAPRGASVFILINIMTAINLSQKMITEKDHERRESQRRVKPVIVALKGEKKKASDKELEKIISDLEKEFMEVAEDEKIMLGKMIYG